MTPTISVVMPVYNGERYLAEAIGSILGQTYTEFEFIIVDDGSTDASPAIIHQYAALDSRIVSVTLEQNRGKATARNRGIDMAGGQYFAMTDCDDVSLPARLSRQLNFLLANPQVAVVGCHLWITDQTLKPLAEIAMPQTHPFIAWGLLFGASIPHSVMIRREALARVRGYEAGRKATDDFELWSRLIDKCRFANLPDVLYLYRQHERSTSGGSRELHAAEARNVLGRMLQRLLGEITEDTIDRILKVRRRDSNLTDRELKLLSAEMTRVADSLVESGWVRPDERSLLNTAIEDTLIRTMTRNQRWLYRLRQPGGHKRIPRKLRQIISRS